MKALLGQKLIGHPEAASGVTVAEYLRGGGAEAPGVPFLSCFLFIHFPTATWDMCCTWDSFLQFCAHPDGPAHMLYFAESPYSGPINIYHSYASSLTNIFRLFLLPVILQVFDVS